ncbi:DUF2784 family protein [bacterium]|nr:DUF2784 family protein [bacterium]
MSFKKAIITTIIKLLGLLHFAVLLFLLFGWVSTNNNVLMTHIFTVLLIMLQWKLNDGTCLLTNLEHYLKRKFGIADTEEKVSKEEEERFTEKLLSKIGLKLTDMQLKVLIYSLLYLSIFTSIYKLK